MDPTVLFWDFMQSLKFIFLGVLGSFPQDLYLAQNVMKLWGLWCVEFVNALDHSYIIIF